MSSKLNNYALQINPVHEVICAYAAAPYSPPLQSADEAIPIVLGAFKVPEHVRCQLSVLGYNLGPATLTMRLFAATEILSFPITTIEESETRSSVIDLEPNQVYQIAADWVGSTGLAAIVRTVSLGSA